MGFLKSLFIFMAPDFLVVAVIMGAIISSENQDVILGLGVILTALPVLLLLSYLFLFNQLMKADRYSLFVSVPTLFGFFMVLTADFDTTSILLAVSGTATSLLYVYGVLKKQWLIKKLESKRWI